MKSERKRRIWYIPLALCAPFAAAAAFCAVRYGREIQNLISLAIKLVVTK